MTFFSSPSFWHWHFHRNEYDEFYDDVAPEMDEKCGAIKRLQASEWMIMATMATFYEHKLLDSEEILIPFCSAD